MNHTLFKFQRVCTSLGDGCVMGFEVFDPKGNSLDVSDFDMGTGGRVVVKLDDINRWTPTERTPNPYMYRSELRVIE